MRAKPYFYCKVFAKGGMKAAAATSTPEFKQMMQRMNISVSMVLIFIGSNDIATKPVNPQTEARRIVRKVSHLVRVLRSSTPQHTRVVLADIWRRQNQTIEWIQTANLINSALGGLGVEILRAARAIRKPDFKDNLHLNEAGYKKIRELL